VNRCLPRLALRLAGPGSAKRSGASSADHRGGFGQRSREGGHRAEVVSGKRAGLAGGVRTTEEGVLPGEEKKGLCLAGNFLRGGNKKERRGGPRRGEKKRVIEFQRETVKREEILRLV